MLELIKSTDVVVSGALIRTGWGVCHCLEIWWRRVTVCGLLGPMEDGGGTPAGPTGLPLWNLSSWVMLLSWQTSCYGLEPGREVPKVVSHGACVVLADLPFEENIVLSAAFPA